jgi:hypothetical protein
LLWLISCSRWVWQAPGALLEARLQAMSCMLSAADCASVELASLRSDALALPLSTPA